MQKIIFFIFLVFFTSPTLADNQDSNKVKIDINKPLCYQVYDPYEKFNRAMFIFNDTLDNTILKPIAKAYNKTVPSWGRARIRGFFTNLSSPLTFLNNIFQGKPNAAAKTFFRFLINSTFGIGGTLDFAKDFGLYENTQVFGNTLARYGANYGAYLVLPFIGPSSIRQAVGMPFDMALNPLNLILDRDQMLVIYAGEKFTTRAEYVDLTSSLQASSLDYYAQVRSIYIQYIARHNPLCKQVNHIDYSIYEDYEE